MRLPVSALSRCLGSIIVAVALGMWLGGCEANPAATSSRPEPSKANAPQAIATNAQNDDDPALGTAINSRVASRPPLVTNKVPDIEAIKREIDSGRAPIPTSQPTFDKAAVPPVKPAAPPVLGDEKPKPGVRSQIAESELLPFFTRLSVLAGHGGWTKDQIQTTTSRFAKIPKGQTSSGPIHLDEGGKHTDVLMVVTNRGDGIYQIGFVHEDVELLKKISSFFPK